MEKVRRVALRSLVFVSTFVALVGALECGARVLIDEAALPILSVPLSGSVNTTTLSHVFQPHPTRFWALRPGLELSGPDFWGDVTNGNGIRRRESLGAKVPGRRRVLCVGDSCTYGLGVRCDEAWPALLDASGLEAINAGVPGYSTFQMERYLEELVPEYAPDALVLTVGNNDCAPWPTQQSGSIVFLSDEERAAHVALRGLARVSRFAAYVIALAAPEPVKLEGRFDDGDFGTSPPRVSVARFIDSVRRMRSAAAESVVVAWARRTDFDPRFGDALSSRAAPYREALRNAFAADPRFVDMEQVFRESGRSAEELYIDNVHVTPLGNRIVAAAIDGALRR